ncbi:hypothetical protein [Streptomyces natalensis]|uniref:Uncharacterized protein n=1 Tax=Streptomyces natalensis ATCC 27448 TaxID=1240678 RepID=A0A0D7CNC6_9ACTN|nr:hypothetical protein [Streptomyces natalensis]KIZ17360.1 hypothetical protein SNA_15250 [Streptomyces natalensis ATCC 27448]
MAEPSPYSFSKTTDWPLGAPEGGCCAGCPIREGCALAADTYVVCPITGSSPPPAPPDHTPAQATAADAYAEPPATRRFDVTEVASRGVETAISGAFGFGWLDLATGLIERFNREDADGNPIDWSRLQLKRNGLSLLVATTVPLGEHTAAQWVAHGLSNYSLGVVFMPVGMALGSVMPVFVGAFAPGPLGAVCRPLWSAVAFTTRATWRFATSRLGWIVTRPAIWAAISGVLLLSGRFLLRVLTGA